MLGNVWHNEDSCNTLPSKYGVGAHPSPSVVHDTLISVGEPVRARWTCRTR